MAIDVSRDPVPGDPPIDRDVPDVAIPTVPPSGRVWGRALIVAAVAVALYLLDKVALLFMDLWLLQSLGYESVFWTNFRIGALLFVVGAVAFGLAAALPAFVFGLARSVRRKAVLLGAIVGVLAGYLMTGQYLTYLGALNGRSFGEVDPVFGHDIGFYVFDLPAIITALQTLAILAAVFLVSCVVWAIAASDRSAVPGMRRMAALAGRAARPLTIGALIALGIFGAARAWVSRYDVLIKDNYDASVYSGAEYLDVTGFFSTVNGYTVSALAMMFGALALALRLRALHRSVNSPDHPWLRIGAVSLILALVPGLAIDFSFRAMTAVRHETQVTPNEPVVQLPFIKRHVDATRKAYGLNDVEHVDFVPNGPEDPAPDVDELLASPTLRNAPLWPGYAAWLESQLDPEYIERLFLAAEGDTMIYGPTLDIFNAQQKLRPYYDVMDVDTVRYNVDGEDVITASATRELPLVEPQPWLAWWGQQYFLFTHGHGLVTAPVSGHTVTGEPDYLSHDIPPKAEIDELKVDQNAIYYGEGAGTMGYSNVRDVAEHDFPTEQGRAEVFFPKDVEAGVRVDSPLKRLVIGYKSRQFLDVLFSDLINPDDTRVHYFRTPLERVERIAPFLAPDTDPYAVAADGDITWMVNAMSYTDRYPYSAFGELGDKSHVRTTTRRPIRHVNYVKDAVKATVNAYTGKIDFYKWTDEPVIDTWAAVYPDLFKDKDQMPEGLQEQVQYPTQLFHLQYDDLYIFYQMEDPLTFFSLEDLFDDADEVVGPILSEGAPISFSIEPYFWIAQTEDGTLPEAKDDPDQFSLSLAFTPEDAVNLRSIITVYQEGDDYGKTSMLQVPKGTFVMGPEQADAAIDQDAFISQQIALWNRQGLEVIRGHTTPLVVGNELIYIEPLFIKSKQNPVPQLKRVVVVLRGHAALGEDLESALRAAIEPPARFPVRPGPELGGEPGFVQGADGSFQEGEREGGFTTAVPRDPEARPDE